MSGALGVFGGDGGGGGFCLSGFKCMAHNCVSTFNFVLLST